jgi:[protein-PII] uridylyltransferase
LHLCAGKRSDILINNYQDRIARELGNESAQEWLSKHYAHAENLFHFRATAVRIALAGPLELGGVTLVDGVLRLSKRAGNSYPASAVRLFQLSQKYDIPVSLEQIETLQNSRSTALRMPQPEHEECWSFLEILRAGKRVVPALRALVHAGLLDRFIDEFTPLMRFAPPDPAHCYTVGEHSLKIIEHLENLRQGRDAAVPRFCELIGQCAHFDMLCLAALLHDIGKMLPGTDHSESGMEITLRAAVRLGLPQEKREILETLVRYHLLLVRTARLQDLKSPGVIQDVADKVRGIDALRHLYVFTYADTRAVAEKNWTSMDYRDLEELYSKVQSLVSGLGGEGGSAPAVEDRLGQIRRKLSSAKPEEAEAVQGHCDSMPASYVLNTPMDEIGFHIQLLERLDAERIVLDIYNRPGDDYSELTVCTFDDPEPGMLAKITGVLYACDTDIHKAQVFTLEKAQPVVLDTLWVRSGGMQLSENRAARVRSGLKEVLSGSKPLGDLFRTAGKRAPESIIVDSVDLRNDLSEEHTVVHIIAHDLQGLLYHMTRTLSRSGLHIHSARVATWNARAENNFYVTTLKGGQIPDVELDRWQAQLSAMFRGQSALKISDQ